MQSFLVLSSEEIHAMIPYAMICMTRYGAHWGAGRRKRRWAEEFTEAERAASAKLFLRSYDWTVGGGVPDKVRMTPDTLRLWMKLGAFCAGI